MNVIDARKPEGRIVKSVWLDDEDVTTRCFFAYTSSDDPRIDGEGGVNLYKMDGDKPLVVDGNIAQEFKRGLVRWECEGDDA